MNKKHLHLQQLLGSELTQVWKSNQFRCKGLQLPNTTTVFYCASSSQWGHGCYTGYLWQGSHGEAATDVYEHCVVTAAQSLWTHSSAWWASAFNNSLGFMKMPSIAFQ